MTRRCIRNRRASSDAIEGTVWQIRVEFPDHVVDAQTKDLLRNTIAIAWLVMAMGTIGGWFLSRRLIRPLRDLTRAAATVAAGDAKQLARSNRELEAFSYTISHDLRAPLRSIDGFSDALLSDYGDRLDETAKGYLTRVRRAATRMGQLIDDLLELARVSRVELLASPVALDVLAARFVRDLRERDPGRAVDVVIRAGTPAQGDARLLALVLQNLFENAWKFTSARANARIEFGVSSGGPPATYFVRDNGVERIVERHGGRVWAEAKPGEGATFFFTLEPGDA